jgi:hypothetical protein
MSSAHDHIPEQTGTFLPVLVTRPGEKSCFSVELAEKLDFFSLLNLELFQTG